MEVFSLQEHFHAIKSDVRQKDDECAPPPFCESAQVYSNVIQIICTFVKTRK